MTQILEETRHAMERDAHFWDEDEYYIIVEEFKEQLSGFKMEFEKFSCCSGALVIRPAKR
jgi:hypothetical protein